MKCEHETVIAIWDDDGTEVITYECVRCDARGVRPLDDTACPACGEAPEACTAGDTSDEEHPDLVTFVDGEATPEQAEATREHLASCEPCGEALVETMQLGAQLSTLDPNLDDRFGHEEPLPRCAKDGAMLEDGECWVCRHNGTVQV